MLIMSGSVVQCSVFEPHFSPLPTLVGNKSVTLNGSKDWIGANYECSEVALSPQASALTTTTASSPSLPPLRPQLPPRPHRQHFWPF